MKGVVIWIASESEKADEMADSLGSELLARGGRVEVLHRDALEKMGVEDTSANGKAAACGMLARHDVIVITSGCSEMPDVSLEDVEVRKVSEDMLKSDEMMNVFVRELELAGLVPPPEHDVHPDEEEEIKKKLSDLGYL
jgi:hypothetical protein